METKAQKIAVNLFTYICNASWLNTWEYETCIEKAKLRLIDLKSFYTNKKLNTKQAQDEIRFACENVPKIYGVRTHTYEETWAKFSEEIEENGLGHYSKLVLMIAEKF